MMDKSRQWVLAAWLVIVLSTTLLILWPRPAATQLGMTPIWQTLTISGHRYIIIKYKDSVGITHDESCIK